MTGFGGELVTKEIPELQAAAVRQSDGAILGQAGTADLIGDRQDSWVAVQRVGVPELFKATALILLEDMVRVRFKEAVAQVQRERPEVPGPPLEPAPPRLPGPEPEIAPLTAAEMALIDNLSLREKAAAYNASVAKLQKRSSEIHAWEHALIGGPPMAKPLPDAPMQMVKAAVKSKAQNL
ncbi:MAG TPA: hypothetical protein VF607_15390, partial [Verrucomicrobiae bacterium]